MGKILMTNLKKRITYTFTFILLFAIIVGYIFYNISCNPTELIENRYGQTKQLGLKYLKPLKEVTVSPNDTLYFYYNGNGDINCAVLKRWQSVYRFVGLCHSLPTHRNNKSKVTFSSNESSRIKQGELIEQIGQRSFYIDDKWYNFAFAYNQQIASVYCNETQASSLYTLKGTVFYSISDENFSTDDFVCYSHNNEEIPVTIKRYL